MRMLFAFAGGRGHLEPLVPLARAAASAGHDVAFAGRPRMADAVDALGFAFCSAGSDTGLAPVARPLAAPDVAREIRAVGAGFGGRIARERARDLIPRLASRRPDVVVCEETDFGAALAAERHGIACATVLVSAAGGFVQAAAVAPFLDAVRADHGLAPDPGLAALGRHLVLSPFPPSFRSPDDAFGGRARPYRAYEAGAHAASPISWLAARARERPLVYFTLGTIFPSESGDLFARVVAGLRTLSADVVVTLGGDADPATLGPQPPHVRIERFVPQAALLPHCDLVVCHGGSGSVLGALAHGLPLLLLPLGADQPLNAARCEALGAARVLDAVHASAREIAGAAAEALASPALRNAAGRLRDEIAALPAPAEALGFIEALA